MALAIRANWGLPDACSNQYEGYDQVAGMMHIDRKFMALHLSKREKTDPHRRRRERSRRICRSELVNVRRNGME